MEERAKTESGCLTRGLKDRIKQRMKLRTPQWGRRARARPYSDDRAPVTSAKALRVAAQISWRDVIDGRAENSYRKHSCPRQFILLRQAYVGLALMHESNRSDRRGSTSAAASLIGNDWAGGR